MAKRLELQIQGSTDFTFDVEGEFTPSVEPFYRSASEPPQLAGLRYVWEFRGCRITPSDGTTATLWTDVAAFFARFENRSAHPTYAQLVRDPDGAAAVVLKIGGTGFEALRFEAIDGERDPAEPDASWSASATFTIRASAVRPLADANGLTGWAQEVRVGYDAGFRVLEWVTTIQTVEGTDAVAKAQALAAIDISSLPTYTYQTNGPDGIEWEVLDPDEVAGRTPTLVRATSRVREWGVSIGAAGGGSAPDSVDLRVKTTIGPDEEIVVTTASARGPNADQWVAAQKPGGSLYLSETEDGAATNEYSGRWERRTSRGSAAVSASTVVEVTISGGGRALRLRPVSGGYPPVVQRGAFLPYTAEVAVTTRRTGGTGLADELPLPKQLGAPWILEPASSKEGDPAIAERGSDASQHVWERRASYVYRSPTKPTLRPSLEIAQGGDAITSYLLPL